MSFSKISWPLMLSTLLWLWFSGTCSTPLLEAHQPRRILLIWGDAEGATAGFEEFEAGANLLQNMVQRQTDHHVILSNAEGEWKEGLKLLERADTVVLYLPEGSQWMRQRPERWRTFVNYTRRGGGFVVLCSAIESQRTEDCSAVLPLWGVVSGGPERRSKFMQTRFRSTNESHPIQNGLRTLKVEDRYYFDLKQIKSPSPIVPLMEANIHGDWYMTAWAWERPDAGRSFGFSGLHAHENWGEEVYRRLVFQGILWTLGEEIPDDGVNVSIKEKWLVLPTP